MIKSTYDNFRNIGAKGFLQYQTMSATGDAIDLSNMSTLRKLTHLDLFRTITSQTIRRSLNTVAHRTAMVLALGAGTSQLVLDVSFESFLSVGKID